MESRGEDCLGDFCNPLLEYLFFDLFGYFRQGEEDLLVSSLNLVLLSKMVCALLFLGLSRFSNEVF